MSSARREPSADIPLTPAVFHILLALADGEKHGYAIMKEVESATEGAVTMGPGTLYGSIKRMLRAGLIRESGERPDPALDDARRRYYEMTEYGSRVLQAEVSRLTQALRLAHSKHVVAAAKGSI